MQLTNWSLRIMSFFRFDYRPDRKELLVHVSPTVHRGHGPRIQSRVRQCLEARHRQRRPST